MNPYEVLGLKKKATPAEVKSAYRSLCKIYHPDKAEGPQAEGDAERFREIRLAYDVLKDPERRARYDRTGRIDESKVTEEAIERMIEQTVKAVITARRPDGSTDDPVWDNIHLKIMLTLETGKQQIQMQVRQLKKQIERTQQLKRRFKSRTDKDPVGKALQSELESLRSQLQVQEDGLELHQAVVEAWKTYDYEVGPEPEGQSSPRPTDRLRGPHYLTSRSARGL